MKLTQLTVQEYLSQLKSNSPAPGGGSASALSGAQGAALAAMVAGLTVGKEKYAQYRELNEAAQKRAGELCELLLQQVDADTQAFNLVFAAYSLPRETPEQKQARKAAIAEASLVATKEPLLTMQLALETLRLTHSLVGCSNTSAASDLGVSALNLLSSIEGAWLNVQINLPSLADEAEAKSLYQSGEGIVVQARQTVPQILKSIEEALK